MVAILIGVGLFLVFITGGRYIVTVGLVLFAFATIIAWCYYGEKCVECL